MEKQKFQQLTNVRLVDLRLFSFREKEKFDFLKNFCYNIYTKFKENQKIIFLFIKEVAVERTVNQDSGAAQLARVR